MCVYMFVSVTTVRLLEVGAEADCYFASVRFRGFEVLMKSRLSSGFHFGPQTSNPKTPRIHVKQG